MSQAPLDAIGALIAARFGLVFAGEAGRRLASAVAARIEARQLAGAARYLALLEDDEDERRTLAEQLTVHETYFFREAEQIRFAADTLVPRLLAAGQDGVPLRILSAGCASGEEPYSLAIALFERYRERTPALFSITAGDLSRPMLARARQAQYSEFSFRGVDAELRARYFDFAGGHYRLRPFVRAVVGFCELNLLEPVFPDGTAPFDIVFMRNVSIYFEKAVRRRILEALAGWMRPGALLITGVAETLANDLGVFELVEEAGLFHFSRPSAPSAGGRISSAGREGVRGPEGKGRMPPFVRTPTGVPPRLSLKPALRPAVAAPQARTGPVLRARAAAPAEDAAPRDLDALIGLVHDERYEQAWPLVSVRLQADPEDHAALLLGAYISLNRQRFDEARAAALGALARDAWSVEAHYLLGLIDKWRGELSAAAEWFKKAVYLNRDCWPAHFHLGSLYAQQGEVTAARRAWRAVLQLLDAAGGGAPGIAILPVGLRPAEVRFLCERRLGRELQLSGNGG